MKYLQILALCTLFFACNSGKQQPGAEATQEETQLDYTSHHTPEITRIFEAHGGYETWSTLKTLSYEMGGSKTLVDLQNRYTRIESEEQTVGFDGENVWVYPSSEDADRQRMHYNLMFYFFAFPFVVGDPGVNYEVPEPIELQGQAYNAVKVGYDAGVGDAPNDSYIVLANPKTDQMEWLLYTATFGGAPEDEYSLIKYENWQDIGGVKLPSKLQWYQYEDGVVGEIRGDARIFENIQVSTAYPAMDNFTMPEGAAMASLPED